MRFIGNNSEKLPRRKTFAAILRLIPAILILLSPAVRARDNDDEIEDIVPDYRRCFCVVSREQLPGGF